MNKKLNTVIFVLVGTIVDLILAFVFILIFLYLVVKVEPLVGDKAYILTPVAFIGGILLAMVLYQRLSVWVIDKFNLHDKLEPFFTRRHKKSLKD